MEGASLRGKEALEETEFLPKQDMEEAGSQGRFLPLIRQSPNRAKPDRKQGQEILGNVIFRAQSPKNH